MTIADMVCTYKPIDAKESGLKENAIAINSMEKEKIYEEFCIKQPNTSALISNKSFSLHKPEMIEHVESFAKSERHERAIDDQLH